jgi:hypothetical protein
MQWSELKDSLAPLSVDGKPGNRGMLDLNPAAPPITEMGEHAEYLDITVDPRRDTSCISEPPLHRWRLQHEQHYLNRRLEHRRLSSVHHASEKRSCFTGFCPTFLRLGCKPPPRPPVFSHGIAIQSKLPVGSVAAMPARLDSTGGERTGTSICPISPSELSHRNQSIRLDPAAAESGLRNKYERSVFFQHEGQNARLDRRC